MAKSPLLIFFYFRLAKWGNVRWLVFENLGASLCIRNYNAIAGTKTLKGTKDLVNIHFGTSTESFIPFLKKYFGKIWNECSKKQLKIEDVTLLELATLYSLTYDFFKYKYSSLVLFYFLFKMVGDLFLVINFSDVLFHFEYAVLSNFGNKFKLGYSYEFSRELFGFEYLFI